MSDEIITGDSLHQSSDGNLLCHDAMLQSLILKSYPVLLDPSNFQPIWRVKQRLLQDRLRMRILLDHQHLVQTDTSESILDSNHSRRLLESEFTRVMTAAAYHQAFHRIQDQDSLLLTQLAGLTNPTRNNYETQLQSILPLETHIQQDATLDKTVEEADVT